jgi:hypothetical protein
MKSKHYTLDDALKWCNGGKDKEPLRMVQMYDRDAIGELRNGTFVFRSDKIAAIPGKIDEIKAAMSFRWPGLTIVHDATIEMGT